METNTTAASKQHPERTLFSMQQHAQCQNIWTFQMVHESVQICQLPWASIACVPALIPYTETVCSHAHFLSVWKKAEMITKVVFFQENPVRILQAIILVSLSTHATLHPVQWEVHLMLHSLEFSASQGTEYYLFSLPFLLAPTNDISVNTSPRLSTFLSGIIASTWTSTLHMTDTDHLLTCLT